MDTALLQSLIENYNWQLSIYAGLGIIAVSLAGRLVRFIPAFGAAHKLNSETLAKKMERPSYAENQRWNRKWAVLYLAVIFGLILPFCLTVDFQSLEDQTVTVRDRDTMAQERVPVAELRSYLEERLV